MSKIVRVYFSTFIDVECEEENYSSEDKMKEDVVSNLSDYISVQEVVDNMSIEPSDIDVFDEEDM